MDKLSFNDEAWINFCAMVKAVRDGRRAEASKFKSDLPRPYPRKKMRTMGAYQVSHGYGYRHKSEVPMSAPIFIERNGRMVSSNSDI